MRNIFREKWADHLCDKAGCGVALVTDGGMKPHQKLCAASLAGVREYEASGVKMVTECKALPSPTSKFCKNHSEQSCPYVLLENMSTKLKEQL